MRPLHFSLLMLLAALFSVTACRAADLTATETRWLQGAWPVLEFARRAGMPLDIVVQPQPTPGVAPLAMAFVRGRCKLVLSMRGNREAQATLERIDPGLLGATLELMAAHELGHCRRYLDGVWHGLPARFAAKSTAARDSDSGAADRPASAARREEGYGDLVGLAWVQKKYPQLYPRLWAWLLAERSTDTVLGADHDTVAWVRLAAPDPALKDASIFEWAASRWAAGLGETDLRTSAASRVETRLETRTDLLD